MAPGHRLCLCFCIAMWALPAAAQQSIEYASVSGRVTDSSGAVVPGAEAVVRHTQTNLTSTAVTDSEGRFRFPYLRVGPYEIQVRLDGFRTVARNLNLSAGSAFELPVTLQVSGVEARVAVSADAPILEAARSQIASSVSELEVRSLPLNGRNFLDLAVLVPGVSPTNLGSTQLFPETSAVPGMTLSVGSQRNLSNNFIVDGLSANDDAAGLSGISYGVDAVEEFQVVTSGAQAELGRALGGYVNIVTKSGTNNVHGTIYSYFRDDRWNAKNVLVGRTLPMNQEQFGGSLGGPVVSNRTFYFTNLERRRLDQTGLTTISDPSVSAINARLAAVGYGGPPVVTGVYANPVHSTNFLAKVDHQVSGRNQLGVRYTLYQIDGENTRGAGALNAPSASQALDNVDQMIAVSNTFALSPRTVLETRARYTRGNLEADPTDLVGPSVNISGVASFGRLGSSPTGRLNHMYQIVNNLSHQAGAHALRAGVDFLFERRHHHVSPGQSTAATAFSSLANFLCRYLQQRRDSRQVFGATRAGSDQSEPRVYAQDEWKLNSQLTLNAGLRYDLQFLETINTDTNNLSPRLGFAWSPFEARRTLVRGGVGALLRSRAAACGGERAAVGREHDRSREPPSDQHQPVAHAGRRTGVPQHPAAQSFRR